MLVVGSDYEQGPSLDPSTGPPLNSERRALHRRSIPQCGRALCSSALDLGRMQAKVRRQSCIYVLVGPPLTVVERHVVSCGRIGQNRVFPLRIF